MTYHGTIAPGCPFQDTAITNSDTDAQWQWFLLHALERRRVVLDSLVEAARRATEKILHGGGRRVHFPVPDAREIAQHRLRVGVQCASPKLCAALM
jgi:hypothetical protein